MGMTKEQQEQARAVATTIFRAYLGVSIAVIGYFGKSAIDRLESIGDLVTEVRIQQAASSAKLYDHERRLDILEKR